MPVRRGARLAVAARLPEPRIARAYALWSSRTQRRCVSIRPLRSRRVLAGRYGLAVGVAFFRTPMHQRASAGIRACGSGGVVEFSREQVTMVFAVAHRVFADRRVVGAASGAVRSLGAGRSAKEPPSEAAFKQRGETGGPRMDRPSGTIAIICRQDPRGN